MWRYSLLLTVVTLVQLLVSPKNSLDLSALIDSGADECFMDQNLADQLQLQLQLLLKPCQVCALEGHLLSWVIQQTLPLSLNLITLKLCAF